MATYVKFEPFVEAIAEKKHNLGSDQLTVALTNSAPSVAFSQLSQLTQITYTNLSSRDITTVTSAQTSGTYKLILQDLTLSATGSCGPFRYVVIYNNTATNDDLISYYDYGSNVILSNGDSFVIDFDASAGFLTIA